MNMQYPISDMFTIIRNGQISFKEKVLTYSSNFKLEILKILKNEGFIKNYKIIDNIKKKVEIELKYFKKKPVIEYIKCASRPGLRIYVKNSKIKSFMSGMGVVIISTSKGLMTDKQAKKLGVGGEIICYVS